MKPHANYECSKCGRIEDLPVDCQRCPYCGRRRGFVRLFDAVNVIGSKGRKVSKMLDKELAPIYERQAVTQASAQSFERGSKEAMEKAYALATPAERAVMQKPLTHRVLPAGSVLSSIPADVRADTRELITPALLNRTVKASWVR